MCFVLLGENVCYLIVESVSFVFLWDVYPVNPKRIIQIKYSRMYTDTSLEFIISIVLETSTIK